ncbi:hypothetical protein VDG1235_3536 [Verrucomicrobiia bacterium DG1235]|nr:hypothetical protein VDG1235_3536 [Verrucomicrobiae bacterium DG1235]
MKTIQAIVIALLAICSAGAREISPMLFGQNYWLSDEAEDRVGYLHLLWPQVEESGVSLIRIGGNGYNVEPMSLAHWTSMVDSVQAIGVEPLVQVPYTFSAEEASAFVKHFNREGRKAVKYWSIGNEPMLHDEHTVEEVHAYLQRIAPAMRAADPSITILISDEAWLREPVYAALCGGDLDMTGRDAEGRWLVDGFSFHSYPNGVEYDREDVVHGSAAAIRRDVQKLVALMEAADAKHGRTGENRLVWALTEVNVTYANPNRDVEGVGNPSFLGWRVGGGYWLGQDGLGFGAAAVQ